MLQPGSYCCGGHRFEILGSLDLGSVRLQERVFPHGFRQSKHFHACPYFSCVLKGTYREVHDSGETLHHGPGLGLDPVGEHESEVLVGPVRTLVVEFDQRDECSALPYFWKGGEQTYLAKRLYGEYSVNDPLTADAVMLLLGELMHAASLNVRPVPQWLAEADESIRYSDGITGIADVAQRAGVLPCVLSRAYRRHFGATPSEVWRRTRIDTAKMLLRKGDCSIGEIATTLGFCDQSHFNRTFVRLAGLPPGAFRKLMQSRYKTS